MSYNYSDLTVLEEDTTKDPKSFTVLFEVPGEIYGQSYPERLRHTFPENGKWKTEVEFEGQTMMKWEKVLVERYLKNV